MRLLGTEMGRMREPALRENLNSFWTHIIQVEIQQAGGQESGVQRRGLS